MKVTVGEVISRVRKQIKAVVQDAFITDRYLYSMIMKHTKWLMKREDSKYSLMKYNSLFEPYHADLVEVDKIEASCNGIQSGFKIMRTKEQIVGMFMTGTYGPIIRAINSIDGSETMVPTTPTLFTKLANSKNFKYNKTKYYWILNNYIYFPNIEWEEVLIEAVFEEDPSRTDENKSECVECEQGYTPFNDSNEYDCDECFKKTRDIIPPRIVTTSLDFVSVTDCGIDNYGKHGAFIYNTNYNPSGAVTNITEGVDGYLHATYDSGGGTYEEPWRYNLTSSCDESHSVHKTRVGQLATWVSRHSVTDMNTGNVFSNCAVVNEFITIQTCINNPSTTNRIYYVGASGDNDFNLKLNGISVFSITAPTYTYGSGAPSISAYKILHVLPLTLLPGENKIEIITKNTGINTIQCPLITSNDGHVYNQFICNPAMLALEVYNIHDAAEFDSITEESLDNKVLFTTKDYRTQEYITYVCDEGTLVPDDRQPCVTPYCLGEEYSISIPKIKCPDCSDVSCKPKQDLYYNVPDYLFGEIESAVVKDLQTSLQIPSDNKNNNQNANN